MTTVGLEPTIFGSEDRRLIHWATRPIAHTVLRHGSQRTPTTNEEMVHGFTPNNAPTRA